MQPMMPQQAMAGPQAAPMQGGMGGIRPGLQPGMVEMPQETLMQLLQQLQMMQGQGGAMPQQGPDPRIAQALMGR